MLFNYDITGAEICNGKSLCVIESLLQVDGNLSIHELSCISAIDYTESY